MSELILSHRLGWVYVTVKSKVDEYPDLSWLGEWTSNGAWLDFKAPVYDTDDDAVHMPGTDFWVNREGEAIDPERGSNFYDEYHVYIQLTNNASTTQEAFADADRFKSYSDSWCCIGVYATCYINQRAIGHASVWGIESDSSETDILSMARDMAREAIDDARTWLRTIQAA